MNEPFSPLQLIQSTRWHSALFGTYVLSLSFFEAIVVPALRQAGVRRIDVLADLDGVAGALGEAGAREVGRTYGLRPVRVRQGVFHPKFMLLDGPEGPSAVIGSGNLTFGGWGHNLELCEVLRPDRSGAALHGLADFLEDLGTADRVSGIDGEALGTCVDRLRAVAPSGDTRVLHSVTVPIATQIVAHAADLGEAVRLTVASPYYGGCSAVDALAADLGSPAVDVHVHDGERLAVNGHHFPFRKSRGASPVTLELLDPEANASPLHAKLIEVECELGFMLVTGSVNASVPSLAEARNVELAVLRIVEEEQPRSKAELPPKQAADAVAATETFPFGILHATLLGTWLRGNVLTAAEAGGWSAEFDHDGTMHEIGVLDVGTDGAFEAELLLPDASYGRRRSTLVLRRGALQIRGFVAFPDAIELNNRWGGAIGPMIRVAGGSDDDDDLAGVLEYFASNPRETASAWRRSAKAAPEARQTGSRLVSLSELEVRSVEDGDEDDIAGSATRGAFDRILAALRVRWTGGAIRGRGARGEHHEVEDPDEDDDGGTGGRVSRAFDALLEVLAERVPGDPAVELQRAGDIAGFVLLRTPEPRRIAEFAAWWCNLAVRHLSADDLGAEIRTMAAGMLVLDGLAATGAERTRGRIARVLGDVGEGLGLAAAIRGESRLRRLTEVIAGSEAIERFVGEVANASSAVEEVMIAARHVGKGLLPPPLRLLDGTEEMRAIRRHVAAGTVNKILAASRDAKSCPSCHYGLPDSERHRLSSIGIARAGNCCNRVLLVGMV